MNSPMNINLNNYPLFTPNQVLTDADLNGVVTYLEGLNQITRTHFVGMGVAYGLEVQHLSNPTRIRITPGCGITSEGLVIQVTAEIGTDYKNTFTHYQDVEVAQSLFSPDVSNQQKYTIKQLLPMEIGQQGGEGVYLLTEEMLTQQVVVALYDWQDLPRPETCQLNYDQQTAKERSFRLRFFLLPSTQPQNTNDAKLSAEQLIRLGYQMEQLPEPWRIFNANNGTAAVFEARHQFLKAKDLALQVQRFGYEDVEKSVDLTQISDYEALQENYFRICESAIASISKTFPELFRLFSPFFTPFQPNSKQDFQTLTQSLSTLLQRFHPDRPANAIEPPYALQYFYDYLSQLAAAFAELVEVAFDLMDDCTPDMKRFPRYLLLGLVPPFDQLYKGFEVPSAYRSSFVQPRIYNSNQNRIQQVRYLYDRLLKLCGFEAGQESFYLLPFYKTPIKITPSKDRSAALSEQAIPYYLNYPKLYQSWNYDAYRKGRSDRHPAYFYPKQAGETTPHVFDELIYRLDAYNFYRIEGHVGHSNTEVLKEIWDYQKRYNLPFDVVTLKLGRMESLKALNLSAQLDYLSAPFAQLRNKFQKLWKEHEQEWSSNVVLTTLKQVFFDQPSLSAVNPDLLLNRFFDCAKASKNYEFVPEQNAPGKYKLFLKNAAGTRIAQYRFRDQNQQTIERLDFTGLAEDAIAQAQKRIIAGLLDALTLNKTTYGIKRQTPSLLRFHLRFLSSDQLTVPLERSGNPSLELATLELISLDTFSIQERPDLKIAENCPDVMTLYGLLRDLPKDDPDNPDLRFKIGDPEAAQQIDVGELTSLIEAYQQQLEQLVSLQLFQSFAKRHPGMEPLGGVPKGGTFILVYVDGKDATSLLSDEQNRAIYDARVARTQTIEADTWLPPAPVDRALPPTWEALLKEVREREDVVVADFCLPYRVSSDAPVVNYVLARPRPVVLLQKTDFCEGDSTSYPFILEPEGGTVKGEGVIFDGQRHVFQPSQISPSSQTRLANGSDITITFSYGVDDTYDTLTVTIHSLPRPELTVRPAAQFNRDESPIEIELVAGTPTELELVQVTIGGTEITTLDPSQYATNGEPETVAIAAQIRNQQTQCTNSLQYTVTINPVPDIGIRSEDSEELQGEAQPSQDTSTDEGEAPPIEPNNLSQPDNQPNQGMLPFLAPLTEVSDCTVHSSNSISGDLSVPIPQPSGNVLLPDLASIPETQFAAPIQLTFSHPDPVSPQSAEQSKPSHKPKLLQALVFGAIATLLSLTWVYSSPRLSGTPQPTSPSNTEQAAP